MERNLENVSSLYTSLKSAGMPDDMIKEIVTDYVKRTLAVVPEISELISKFLANTSSRISLFSSLALSNG